MRLPRAASVIITIALAASAVSADPRRDCALDGACCFPTKVTGPSRWSHHTSIVGSGTASQELALGVVRRYVKKNGDAIAACAVEGRGSIDIVIVPSGKAQLVRATGFDGKATSCMSHVIARIRFPPFDGTTRASFPLTVLTQNEIVPPYYL